VYREVNGGGVDVVCDFTTETSCIDASPPPRTGAPLEYWVVALDLDPQDQQREGAPSARVDVNAPNAPPNPPLELALATDVDGNKVLRWTPAAVPDPDGDPLDSYTIYRDGTAIANRYDSVLGTETSVIIHDLAPEVHDYWIAAVDSRQVESTLVGPVTG
jgi:hypothetical protein